MRAGDSALRKVSTRANKNFIPLPRFRLIMTPPDLLHHARYRRSEISSAMFRLHDVGYGAAARIVYFDTTY